MLVSRLEFAMLRSVNILVATLALGVTTIVGAAQSVRTEIADLQIADLQMIDSQKPSLDVADANELDVHVADPQIAAALRQISAQRIQENIEKLVSFGPRSTLSAQDPAAIAMRTSSERLAAPILVMTLAR